MNCRIAPLKLLVMLSALCLSSPAAVSETSHTTTGHQLIVGTKESPPFAFRSPDGKWMGISIDLWRHLADELNLEYEFDERSLDQLFAGLETRELDVSLAALSVTAERLKRVDFCHPHYTTGLGIAVSATRHGGLWAILRRVVSTPLLLIVGVMIGIVITSGFLFWWFERKLNESMFGGRRRHGIGMGVWWSTILLLGHKGVVPVSIRGRIVALSAMLASLLLISLLTGVIASVLTVQQLDTGISHPTDLRHVRTVTVPSSTSSDYLSRRRIGFQTRVNAEEMLQAIVNGEADAAVYDEAMLKYLVNSRFSDTVHVLPLTFHAQEYAIALQTDSPLRKPLNEALLRFRATDLWDELIYRYLGE